MFRNKPCLLCRSVSTSLAEPTGRLQPTIRASVKVDTRRDVDQSQENGALRLAANFSRSTLIRQKTPSPAYTLSPLIEMSQTLQRLVDLGVNLAALEEAPQLGNSLLRLDWQQDVVPRLTFLARHAQLDKAGLAHYIDGNPWIFQQQLDDLNRRVTYLESKALSQTAIARIVTAARYWLNLDVNVVDQRLAWVQTEFQLDADQLRFVVTKNPKLITLGTGHIQLLQFSFLEEMGFNRAELTQLMLSEPFLFTSRKEIMRQTFDFVHNTLHMTHEQVVQHARILRCYSSQLKARHAFLAKHGRAQYDAHKPNYISLSSLAMGTDATFCNNVAKCSVNEYNQFLKRVL